jgi:hypothetical protein
MLCSSFLHINMPHPTNPPFLLLPMFSAQYRCCFSLTDQNTPWKVETHKSERVWRVIFKWPFNTQGLSVWIEINWHMPWTALLECVLSLLPNSLSWSSFSN